jgi:hypothetical protein
MLQLLSLIFTLMLATQAAWSAPARDSDVDFQAKSVSTRHISCTECYEIESKTEFIQSCLLNAETSQLQPGDEVLAFGEWKERGAEQGADQRLSYEKVTDVFSSHKEQTLIHITLDNGEQLTATEGHPFLTSEGWRDAILLKKGGKLLIKGEANEQVAQATQASFSNAIYKPNQPVAPINTAQSATGIIAAKASDSSKESYRTILEVRQERQTVPVFNIEVANAHTFFVGEEGVLVHNAKPNGGVACKHGKSIHNDWIDRYIRRLQAWTDPKTTTNVRKNQRQVDANGTQVGTNRPDIQFDRNGVHHNREVDNVARNSQNHLNTLNRNDPNAVNRGSVLK